MVFPEITFEIIVRETLCRIGSNCLTDYIVALGRLSRHCGMLISTQLYAYWLAQSLQRTTDNYLDLSK